jgi:DNA repair exonuclease SbcCD nuclease subunit
MIRIIATADLHLTEGPRLDPATQTMEAMFATVVEDPSSDHPPDLLIVAGDLFGRTVPHRPTTAEREALEPWLVKWAEVCPIIIVRGNHDHPASLRRLQDLGGAFPLRVLDVEGLSRVITPSGDLWLYALPYRPQGWSLDVEWPRGQGGIKPLVVGHLTVKGSVASGGEVLRGDREPSLGVDDLITDEINAPVILGHIHKPQTLVSQNSGRQTLIYPGSLWPADYAEEHEHGWVEVLYADHRVDVSPHPSDHIPVRTVDARWEDGSWVDEDGEEILLDGIKGKDIRLRLRCSDVDASSCQWEEAEHSVRVWAPAHLTVERIIEPTERDARCAEICDAKDLRSKLAAWLNTLDPRPADDVVEAMFEAMDGLEDGE